MDFLPRVDAHIHLFRSGFHEPGYPGGDVGAYDRYRHESNVSAALVVGYEGQSRFTGNNLDILGYAANHPWIVPLAYVEPATIPQAGSLAEARELGFKGFSLYLPEEAPSVDTWPGSLLDELSADNAIISVNASPRALERGGDALARLDGAHVLVSHLGSPGPSAANCSPEELTGLLRPLTDLSVLPHIAVKVSGLYAIDPPFPHLGARPAVTTLLEAFGSSRLVWGSDFSPALDIVDSSELMAEPGWLADDLTTEELSAVLSRNLIAMIGNRPEQKRAL